MLCYEGQFQRNRDLSILAAQCGSRDTMYFVVPELGPGLK